MESVIPSLILLEEEFGDRMEDVSKNEETGEDVLFSESFVCISPSRKKMNERVP